MLSRWMGCIDAATPSRAKRAIVSSGAVSMCSMRCMTPGAAPAARYASSVSRIARSPIAWVEIAKPARAKRPHEGRRSAPGRARTAGVPPPLPSGSSSHAVPDSTTPSMKNFATPPRQRRPARVAHRSCSSTSSSVTSGGWWEGHQQPHRQPLLGLQLPADVEQRRRSEHHVHAGHAERVLAREGLRIAVEALLLRGRRIAAVTRPIAPISRSSPVGHAVPRTRPRRPR